MSHDPNASLVRLEVVTRHPHDYVLLNEEDGSAWRGTSEGAWVRHELPWREIEDVLRQVDRYAQACGQQNADAAARASQRQALALSMKAIASRGASTASPGDEDLLRQALLALEQETGREWDGMNSYHPALWAALKALRARFAAPSTTPVQLDERPGS